MNGWIDGWMNEWVDEWKIKDVCMEELDDWIRWMDGWINDQMDGQKFGVWMSKRKDEGCIHVWMTGLING